LTLVLAVWNEAGVALAADGLLTYGSGAPGSQQLPGEKLARLGDRCAVGLVNEVNKARGMIEALQGSALASEPTTGRTKAEWLALIREVIASWTRGFLTDAVFVEGVSLDSQFETSILVIAGIASDGAFAWAVDWRCNYAGPDAPHYLAQGSGATSARIYLDAYSYFDVAEHPVVTLQALAARVVTKVSGNNIEIGGEMSLVLIHRDTSAEHPDPMEFLSLSDLRVTESVTMWELLEEEMDHQLRKAWEQPVAAATVPHGATTAPASGTS